MNIAINKEIQTQRIPLGGLNGGLWLDLPADEIPRNGWSDGFDFIVDESNRLAPRKGRQLMDDIDVEMTLTTTDLTVGGIAELDTTGAAAILYVFIGTEIVKYNGSVWSSVSTTYIDSASQWQFQRAGTSTKEFLFCVALGNELIAVDEGGVLSKPNTAAFYPTNQLKPRCVTHYKGRLWIAGDPKYPSSVFASYAGAPQTWTTGATTADAQEVLVGQHDGDPVIAIVPKYGMLFVIKRNSIWYIDANDPDPINWLSKKHSGNIGMPKGSTLTAVDVGKDLIFCGHHGDVHNMRDTDASSGYGAKSISQGQIVSYLKNLVWDGAIAIADDARGWYLLACSTIVGESNDAFVIFDYGKAGEDGRGSWYRIKGIKIYDNVAEETVTRNGRASFGYSTLYGSGEREILSGGYDARIYREFSQVDEDLDEGTSVMIYAWLHGPHIHTNDFCELHVIEMNAFAKYGGAQEDASLAVGVVVDPYETNQKKVVDINLQAAYADAMYWGRGLWGTAIWGSSADEQVNAPMGLRGRVFAPYIVSLGTKATIFRLFAQIRAGRV